MDKNDLLKKCNEVIKKHFVNCEFDSHDFIKRFLATYEDEYRKFFSNLYVKGTHAQLAKFLSLNADELGIKKLDELSESENFHGEITLVHKWSSRH